MARLQSGTRIFGNAVIDGNTTIGSAGAISGQFHTITGNINQATSGGIVYINTTGNVLLGGNLFVGGGFANIFSPSISTDSALQIVGNVARGGASYHDFLRVTSTASGATNPNKHFRLTGAGNIEIVNSAYSSTIFSLTDAGVLIVTSYVKTGSALFVNLPSAAIAGAGARGFITDGNSLVWGGAVAGGGINAIPVFSNGTSWRVG